MKQTEREIKNFFLSINFYVHDIRIKKKKKETVIINRMIRKY